MTLYLLAIIAGFALLVWSADRFVEGAASTAKHLGMPTLLIGILIVGFGTVRAHSIWPPHALALGHPAHQHLATARIDHLAS